MRSTGSVAAAFAAWTLVAVVFAGHTYLADMADGRAVSFRQVAWWSAAEWYTWALLTPAVVLLVRRVRAAAWPVAAAVLALAGGGLAIAALQVALEYAADRAVVLLSGDPEVTVRVWLSGGASGAPTPLGYLLPRKIGFSVVTFCAVATAVAAADFYRLYRDRELRAAWLESALAGAQLQALQAQLQPHFLFNTLNTIASLIPDDPAAAEEMVESLSELLRAALHDAGRHEIPLARELELLDQYLRIQQLRFHDRLRVERDLRAGRPDALVPPLLLQPLVENAIRHAIADGSRSRASTVTVRAARTDDQLVLTVEDDGPGFAAAAADHRREPGARPSVGLPNTRARLERLYGGAASLETGDRPGGGAVVRVRLPLRVAAPPAAALLP